MATRTISTKLAIDGESEYKASLTRINAELRSLQSSLKLSESQFKNNSNSIEALTAKGAALDKLCETQKLKVDKLQDAMEKAKASVEKWTAEKARLKSQLDATKKSLAELGERTTENAEEYDRLTEESKRLSEELTTSRVHLNEAQKSVHNWQAKLNTAQIKLADLDSELRLNAEYLEEAKNSSDNCATSIDRFGNRVKEAAEKSNSLYDALAAAGVIAALKKTADALRDCVDASVEFESAMAGVQKTTNLSDEEISAMGDAIQDLATRIPVTATEIAKVTEAAGQLGIARDSLLNFAEVMVNLGVATELSSTEAASALAKFANVVNMSAADYERLGSAIVDLGNNSATMETDIVSMATRLASTGAIVGLTEAEIMALATTMSSVGIEAEAGATAISKVLKQFETLVATASPELSSFAAVAGMTANQFSEAWSKDAVGALSAFIDGLGSIEAAGGSSIVILEELGLNQDRVSSTIQSLANAHGLLTESLAIANTAWEENTALATEAATKYATTESQLQLFSNAADNFKIAVGDALTPTIGALAGAGSDALNGMAEFVENNPAVTQALAATVTTLGTLVAGLTAYQTVVRAAKFLDLPGVFSNIATSATGAVSAFNGLSAALGGVGVAAGTIGVAIASVVASVAAIKSTVEDMTTTGHIETTSIEEAEANLASMNKRLDEAQAKYNALADSGSDLSMAMYELDVARAGVINATEDLEKLQEAEVEAEESFGDLGNAAATAADEVESGVDSIGSSTELVQQQIDDLATAYSEAYESAKASIGGQIGLFGNFSAELSDDLQTIDQMKERWLEQADAIAQYTENLTIAAQYKLDDNLLGELSDGSAESAAYLAAIIGQIQDLGESSEEATTLVNELNAAFQAREESVDTFASVQAAIEANLGTAVEALATAAEEADFSGFESALQAAFANLDLDFSVIWTKLTESMTSEKETGAVSEAVAGTVESAVQAAGEAMSESAGELGARFIDGMASGAAEEEEVITETVASMGETLTGAMTEAATSSVNAFIEEFQKIQDRTNERIAALQAMIVEETAGMPVSMRAVGQGVVDGMIAGLNDRESSLYARIRSIVNTSIEAAREAAAVHSPSDKTTYIFEQVGEGMIVGAENKREKVKETLQSVVDEALRLDISGTATIEAAISHANNPESQMEAALSKVTSAFKGSRGDVNINLYPKSMTKSEIDYFAKKISRTLGLEV